MAVIPVPNAFGIIGNPSFSRSWKHLDFRLRQQ